MNKIKRAVHLDFHNMPGIGDFGSEWNAAEFAGTLSAAAVTQITVFAQCNLGFSYYNTKIGIPYPGLKTDLLKEMTEECHKSGIKVVAYISAGLNHEQSLRHPEWSVTDEEGRIIWGDRTSNFFRLVCYNTGYRDYLISVVRELLCYEVDGFFFDNCSSRGCYCRACTDKMLLSGVDITSRLAVDTFGYESALEFVREVRAVIPSGKSVFFNGLPAEDLADVNTHAEIECLPGGFWGYDTFAAHSAYARRLYGSVLYMTGRFQANWGDFGGIKPRASMENDFYDALLAGAGCSLGDHMHPRCRLDAEVYKELGAAYRNLTRYEPWTDSAEYMPQLAAVVNPMKVGRAPVTDGVRGLARMLGELKYTYDIINESMDFSAYEAVILPDEIEMTELLRKKLTAYLQAGGRLLSSGKSGLDGSGEHFIPSLGDFIQYNGTDETDTSYYKEHGSDTVRAMYAQGIFMTAPERTRLATYVKPYFTRHYDGRHGYFYTPPQSETVFSAAACKNSVCHISFKIFDAYYRCAAVFHKSLVKKALNGLGVSPWVKSDLPSTARIGLGKIKNGVLLHIKTTYPEPRGQMCIIEEHTCCPAGKTVSVKGEFSSCVALPGEKPLDIARNSGCTEITLPQINGYCLLLLTAV